MSLPPFARPAVLTGALLLALAPSASADRLTSATLRAAKERTLTCTDGIANGRAVVKRRVTAPGRGLVRAQLRAATGDWDVAIFDARTRRVVAGAAGFGAREVAEGFVSGPRRLIVQACRRNSDVTGARLTVGFVRVPKRAEAGKLQLLHVLTPTRADKERLLATGLDVTEHGGETWLEVLSHGDSDLRALTRAGFGFEVEVPDLLAAARAQRRADRAFAAATTASGLPSGRDTYRRLFDYENDMKLLVERYPGLVKPLTLSEPTLTGRMVHGIEITTDANRPDGKPVFLQMGVHHAREWPSSEHAMEWAFELTNGYGSDERVTRLVESVRTIVVPVVNVDGFNLSREAGVEGAPTKHEYKRKNCRITDATTSLTEEQCFAAAANQGVDPNRNYGGLWGGPGQSRSLTSETYSGAGPFSEPESRNVQDLVSTRQVGGLITNHTHGGLVLRPPGVKAQGPPKDEVVYKALGDAMASHNGYASQWSYQLYDTTGTTEDWTYFATGGFGFTFEIGTGGNFHLPYEEHVVGEYLGGEGRPGGNREAYFEIMEVVANPEHHGIVRGAAKAGQVLTLSKTFETKTSDHNLLTPGGQPIAESFTDTLSSRYVVPRSGQIEWHVNPSTRPLVGTGHDNGTETSQGFAIAQELPTLPARGQSAQGTPIPRTYEDIPFTVGPQENNGWVRVDVDPAGDSDDYDLVLLQRRASDGALVELGSSRIRGGATETVRSLHAGPGEYVVRVLNYQGVTGWSGTVAFEAPEPREAYTLTCTDRDGRVLSTQPLVIDRGEVVPVSPCRRKGR